MCFCLVCIFKWTPAWSSCGTLWPRGEFCYRQDGCLSLSGCDYKQRGWFMTEWAKGWIATNIMVKKLHFTSAARSSNWYNITPYHNHSVSPCYGSPPPRSFYLSFSSSSCLIPLFSFAHAEECYPLVAGQRATGRPERRKRGRKRAQKWNVLEDKKKKCHR